MTGNKPLDQMGRYDSLDGEGARAVRALRLASRDYAVRAGLLVGLG